MKKANEELNEIKGALADWVRFAFQRINDALLYEANQLGYTAAGIEAGKYSLIHKVQNGKVEGCRQITYGIKEKGQVTPILLVEFGLTGFAMIALKKTQIIKNGAAIKNLRNRR